MMSSTATTRIIWIDYFKTIAIFIIVLSHGVYLDYPISEFFYTFNVPAFFLISGLLDNEKKVMSVKDYVIKNTYSLLLPFLIWNIVLCIINYNSFNADNFLDFFLGLYLYNAASWFLPILFLVKLIVFLFHNKKYLLVTIICLLVIISFITIKVPFSVRLVFLFLPFYVFGKYCKEFIFRAANYFQSRLFINYGLLLLLFFVELIVFIYTPIPHVNYVKGFMHSIPLYMISGFIGSFIILLISLLFSKNTHIITVVSNATLFIMCSHYEFLQMVFTDYSFSNDWQRIAICVITYIVLVLASSGILKYIPILAGRKYQKVR